MKYYIPKGYRRIRIGELIPNGILLKYWVADGFLDSKNNGKWVEYTRTVQNPTARWNSSFCIHIIKKIN